LVENQPGKQRPALFIAAARSATGDPAILYLPQGGAVSLRRQLLRPDMLVSCVDPSNGGLLWRKPLAECGDVIDTGAETDRVLVIRS
jgi:hypothetical protein